MEQTTLAVACNLVPEELQERRNTLLRRVKNAVVAERTLPDGYAYGFPPTGDSLVELANLIAFERQCCPFLSFNLRVEPGAGPIWLELTGPAGTRDFLDSLFA